MMPTFRILLCSLLFTAQSHISYALSPAEQWSQLNTPSQEPAQSIGTYTHGCVRGATNLAWDGEGYQVMRLSRQRYYGHPHLINFIQQLAKDTESQLQKRLFIGDLGQARGGPTPSGHRSHQTGLDVDIWFALAEQNAPHLTDNERETLSAPSMLASEQNLSPQWTTQHSRVLELAAQSPDVARIFVNPVIKRELCQQLPLEKRAWLRKIRPWWKHDDHFHVRLHCPDNSPHCQTQEPLPAGDGCGADLAWWFSEEARHPTKKEPSSMPPALPALCQELLTSK